MHRGLGPACRLARGFDCIADVFSIPEWRFAEQLAIPASYFYAVAGIRSHLLATDIEFHRSVNCGFCLLLPISRIAGQTLHSAKCGGVFEPGWFQILKQALSATLAAIAALAIAAEPARGVEQVGAIDPNDASLELRCDLQCHVDALAPHASRQAVDGVVGKFYCLRRRAKGHCREDRAENCLLRNYRGRMQTTKPRRSGVQPARRRLYLS